MSKSLFFTQFLKNIREIGSITPSSRFLINKLLKPLDLANAKCVVELGAGDGCVTKEILKRMNKNAKLLAFEINSEFCKVLEKIEDNRLIIINDSAENIADQLREQGFNHSDITISGLPFSTLQKPIKEKVFRSIKATIAPKGKLAFYQYSLYVKKRLQQDYNDVKIGYTFLNVPPAFVYCCTAS